MACLHQSASVAYVKYKAKPMNAILGTVHWWGLWCIPCLLSFIVYIWLKVT